MRVPVAVLVVLILVLPMRAQQSNSDEIVRAFELWRSGQPKAAIAILEPLLQADSRFADERDPQAAYARILRASGAKREGARMAKEASTALADLERLQCSGCTIDANGFR